MTEPVVVEVVRSGFVESVHLVDVAVTDTEGRLVAFAGDPQVRAAFRSSAKPIQARACLDAGWTPRDDEVLAIACASHNGEARHVDATRASLAAAGLSEDALLCPAALPAFEPAILAATERRRVTHNCSGKHAAFLATCVVNGWPLASYRDGDHPLQRRIRALIEGLCDGIEDVLVDGCGVPTFTAPLAALARAFRSVADDDPVASAMRAHPFLVGGSERLDTDLMLAAPHVITKAGAEGLACATAGGYGIALKSRDGFANRSRGPALLLVLRALGLVDEDHLAALAGHVEPPVLGGGVPVGAARAHGSLAPA